MTSKEIWIEKTACILAGLLVGVLVAHTMFDASFGFLLLSRILRLYMAGMLAAGFLLFGYWTFIRNWTGAMGNCFAFAWGYALGECICCGVIWLHSLPT